MKLGDVLSHMAAKGYDIANPGEIADRLYRLDAGLYRDVIKTREGWESVEPPTPYRADEPERVLLLGAPDDEAYLSYIQHHLCLELGEEEQAANAAAMYNSIIDGWRRAYLREHRGHPTRFRFS